MAGKTANSGMVTGGGMPASPYPGPYYSPDTGITGTTDQQRQKRNQNTYEDQIAGGKAGDQYTAADEARQAGFAATAESQKAGLQAAAEARRFAQFSPLMSQFSTQFGGGSGSTGVSAPVQFAGTPGTPPPPQIGMGPASAPTNLNAASSAAEDAARASVFARAKDTAGQVGRSAMTALNGVMGARGLTGSGIATNQLGGIINQQASQLGDVSREQAIQELGNVRERASEQYQGALTQRGQDQNLAAQQYQGAITQRGQDLSTLGQQYQGAIEQRGQDLQREQAQRMAMQGLLQGYQGNITARY